MFEPALTFPPLGLAPGPCPSCQAAREYALLPANKVDVT
jgi:hypothetical protein